MNKKTLYITALLYFSVLSSSNSYDMDRELQKYHLFEHQDPQLITDEKFFDINDKAHLLEEYENKVIIINFWATWCTFCTSKIKSLDQFQKLLKNEPVKIIALSEDFKGKSVVEEFYTKKNIKNLEVFVDKKNALFKAFEIIALPTTVIIDSKGYEVARIVGVVDWNNDDTIKELISKYTSLRN